jgi:hypothetical protein
VSAEIANHRKWGKFIFRTAHFGKEREEIFIFLNVQTGALSLYQLLIIANILILLIFNLLIFIRKTDFQKTLNNQKKSNN